VLLAAAGVFVTGSAWPDVAMELLIAAMFATSAFGVMGEEGARCSACQNVGS
jgi:hypothetical protein